MNRYFKNFILCGDIDQYCLLCKESFYLILDIEKHVRWEKHRKNVKAQSCLRQYQNDLIYKIEDNFYCAVCNFVINNVDSVKEHIKTEKHELLKEKPDAILKKPVGQVNSSYVIIDKVIMNTLQWNSIIDKTCHICNMVLENVDAHIASEEHKIKLIQCPANYSDNQYYRKINDETYYCFACKRTFAMNNFVEHWVLCENTGYIEIKKLKDVRSKDIAVDGGEGTSRSADIEKELIETMKDYYDINETENFAKCKYCPVTVPISFNSMMKHMKDKHGERNSDSSSDETTEDDTINKGVPDKGLQRSELAKLGEKIYIKMNHNGSKGYCKLCDKYISPHKSQFKLHCKGMSHRGYLEIVGLKKIKLRDISLPYEWKSFNTYITSIQNLASEEALWINGQYFVDVYALLFLYVIPGDPHYKMIKCHACIDIIKESDVVPHCLTMKHKVLFSAAKILVRSGEFIREVRPFLYHCGFCNLNFPYSKVLEDHLKTKKHIALKEKKTVVKNVANFIRQFNPSLADVPPNDEDLYNEVLQIAGLITQHNTV